MPRFDRLELESESATPTPGPGEAELGRPAAEAVRDEQYWLRLADADRRQALYENALRYYSRALEQDKSLVAGWVGQVQMLVMLGENPEADLWAKKALELFKNHPDLLAGRAQALCRRGNKSEARAVCDGAMAQPGQSAYRWVVRGELMLATGQAMDRYCFDKATQPDTDWLVPFEVAAVYRHYDRPSKALLYARQAAALSPGTAAVWFRQAGCEFDLDLADAARRSLRRCLELSPHHAEAQQMLTKIEHRGWSPGRALRRLFRRS
jgi:tetratricopeptide (TPR) repeat protein